MAKSKKKTKLSAFSRFSKKQLIVMAVFVLGFGGFGVWKLAFSKAAYSSAPYFCNVPKATIKRGSTGDCVRYLQWTLKNYASQNISVDGSFGPATETAVKNLQSFFGKSADGIVGPVTWEIVDLLIRPIGNDYRASCKDMAYYTTAGTRVYTLKKGVTYKWKFSAKNHGQKTWNSFIVGGGYEGARTSSSTAYSGVPTATNSIATLIQDITYPSAGTFKTSLSNYTNNQYFGPVCEAKITVTN